MGEVSLLAVKTIGLYLPVIILLVSLLLIAYVFYRMSHFFGTKLWRLWVITIVNERWKKKNDRGSHEINDDYTPVVDALVEERFPSEQGKDSHLVGISTFSVAALITACLNLICGSSTEVSTTSPLLKPWSLSISKDSTALLGWDLNHSPLWHRVFVAMALISIAALLWALYRRFRSVKDKTLSRAEKVMKRYEAGQKLEASRQKPVHPERPITSSEDDSLGHQGLVDYLHKTLIGTDLSEGFVVGVEAEWGMGKTSLINLFLEDDRSAAYTTIKFNPWSFVQDANLTKVFMNELGKRLQETSLSPDRKLKNLLNEYADVLSGQLAGIDPLSAFFGATLSHLKRKGSHVKTVIEIRNEISDRLLKRKSPMLVIVDDLDRLPVGEVTEVFRLVRLTANFPNLVYLLAFDRERIANQLNEAKLDGDAYLEKICQFTLPVRIPIAAFLNTSFEDIRRDYLSQLSSPEEQEYWEKVKNILFLLITTPRQMNQLKTSFHGLHAQFSNSIHEVDLLLLEALRQTNSSLYSQIRSNLKERHGVMVLPRGSIKWTRPKYRDVVDFFMQEVFPENPCDGYANDPRLRNRICVAEKYEELMRFQQVLHGEDEDLRELMVKSWPWQYPYSLKDGQAMNCLVTRLNRDAWHVAPNSSIPVSTVLRSLAFLLSAVRNVQLKSSFDPKASYFVNTCSFVAESLRKLTAREGEPDVPIDYWVDFIQEESPEGHFYEWLLFEHLYIDTFEKSEDKELEELSSCQRHRLIVFLADSIRDESERDVDKELYKWLQDEHWLDAFQ